MFHFGFTNEVLLLIRGLIPLASSALLVLSIEPVNRINNGIKIAITLLKSERRPIFSISKPKSKDSLPKIGYSIEGVSPKPYQIWENILVEQLKAGDVIADPFAGSRPMYAAINQNNNLLSIPGKAYINVFE